MRLTVPARFNGPPGSANGGWVSGLLAGLLGPVPGGVRVRLMAPPPLGVPMQVAVRDGGGAVEASVDGTPVLQAQPGEVSTPEPPPVPFAAALAAEAGYPGRVAHPFPTCFACGIDRAPGDGLRLAPGPVPGRDVCATTWTPDAGLGGDPVPAEACWAAMDCPGGWAVIVPGRPMVLGTMTAQVLRRPRVGEACVVVGASVAATGRKHRTATALYSPDGELLGRADAVWIRI